jgi:hypothetical protein
VGSHGGELGEYIVWWTVQGGRGRASMEEGAVKETIARGVRANRWTPTAVFQPPERDTYGRQRPVCVIRHASCAGSCRQCASRDGQQPWRGMQVKLATVLRRRRPLSRWYLLALYPLGHSQRGTQESPTRAPQQARLRNRARRRAAAQRRRALHYTQRYARHERALSARPFCC